MDLFVLHSVELGQSFKQSVTGIKFVFFVKHSTVLNRKCQKKVFGQSLMSFSFLVVVSDCLWIRLSIISFVCLYISWFVLSLYFLICQLLRPYVHFLLILIMVTSLIKKYSIFQILLKIANDKQDSEYKLISISINLSFYLRSPLKFVLRGMVFI